MIYKDLTTKDKAILFRLAKKCAICKGKSNSGRLVTDHCHTTGIVRGVLCEKCNSWLGVIEGKRDRKFRISYIKKLERKTNIPSENFMFYLDDFRRAYIASLFESEGVPKFKKTTDHLMKDKPQPSTPKGEIMLSVSLED
jgi:hypothetical protein